MGITRDGLVDVQNLIYPNTAVRLRSAPFLQQKNFLKMKVIRKEFHSNVDPNLTFFPKQRLEPVKDFVDDREHFILGPTAFWI